MKALRWKNKDKGKKGETKQTETNTKATIKPRKKGKVKMMMNDWKGENVSVHLQFEEWQFSAKILQRC